ncbi:glycosyl hydrolase family 18 protein [Ralstonia sp. ASV6]|uniref:glycosyl hydrolase family 18 protein n=1 Tax=Ralstonia sp. ASV6 TaxID=2795124 RepID=UPI0018EA71F7|nr:glycosyl hydrolase family 18 protein [Ralstonia sp. ASV6]
MKVIGLIGAAYAALLLSACGGGDGASATGAVAPAATPPTTTKISTATPKMLLGYALGSTTSMAAAMSATTPVNAISIDVVRVDANGSLNGTLSTALLSNNQSAGKLSYACITNFGTDFDPAIAHGALVTNRATTLQNIVTLAKTQNLAGINLDFEGLYTSDRDAYTSFVADLATQLHANQSTLMLSLPAKTADAIGNTWTWPYDYAALGQSADLIQVMTYDEHVPSGQPGPVAGSDWMLASLQYAAGVVPAAKLLLGLPAYGYDWNRTRNTGTSVAFKDIPALITTTGATAQWDATTQSGHFNYTATDGSAHEVWYETAQGLQTKAAMANTLNLAGVSMWVLGAENASFWSAITAVVH